MQKYSNGNAVTAVNFDLNHKMSFEMRFYHNYDTDNIGSVNLKNFKIQTIG